MTPAAFVMAENTPLREIALLFLRLGVTAFGGPAAHIAMMRDEVVERRKWLTSEEFLDLLGATNLIPGPNSTEMAIHIGHRRRGFAGLVVAGACFIVPAALITLAFAWLYVRYGRVPEARGVLYGVKPVIIAVVVQALIALVRTAVRSTFLALLGILAVAATFFGAEELVILFGAGLVSMLWKTPRGTALVPAFGMSAGKVAAASSVPSSLGGLFFVFAKIGSVLFGSGYVLLAFLRTDLVEHRGWLTESQLVDAVAVGQLTPGPVFTTATFVGYLVSGPLGACVATLGIFFPAFVFVALSGALVPRLRRSPRAASFLDGVNVASLALMVVVTFELGRSSLVDLPALVLAVLSGVLLFRFKVNSAWLVLGGAAAGVALQAVR
ncbi:Chromate transport protein ChrA [Labilithrix luteola]|uniref:Chromate transport protein ChrA n=1 Tax=Labilithrix luteola TaxID=1391654 RepID=A0A0K1PS68_9BACT|nr:chromate efflux transporter [Labilithrix luteola]AKU96367.1 Chromate transport protein ChrA [Labilithrix luteola]